VEKHPQETIVGSDTSITKCHENRTTGKQTMSAVPVRNLHQRTQNAASLDTRLETILVVDDEQTLRRTNRRALERHGYVVLDASTAEEAIEILRAAGSIISLVVCDLGLPMMGGLELINLLKTFPHSPRVLLVSGYNADHIDTMGGLPSGVAFLGKPYLIPDLLREVRTILENHSAQGGQPE
jgi:DNA-binding response OmpR family regulator